MNHLPEAEFLVEALSGDPERIRRMFDLFPLGVIMTDDQGRMVYYNEAHSKIDGLTPEEVLGRLEIEVLVPVTGPNIMRVCQSTAQPILGYIYPYRTIKGRVVNAAYWVYPIKKGAKVAGAICFTQPLLSEFNQQRAYTSQPIQWPGTVPINVPLKSIVGSSPLFQKALSLVKANAANPFPLLIAGETGSGKEMLAKLTHQASPRRKKPYLAINCSAIPGTLLEGLLFGTVKGSFTGAIDRPGLLEEARGGTLYLDEIDSMPLELQPKLLRAIQEMRISRVGSSQETELDFKLVSSIGSSPQKALTSGNLRADLFYRLAVVVVNIPPLRERPEDLEELSEFFINKYNNILGKEAVKLDRRLWDLMRAYHWPGNVRELEHMLAGTLAQVGDEHIIGPEHVPDHYIQAFANDGRQWRNEAVPASPPEDAGTTAARPGPDFPQGFEPRPSGPLERLRREERKLIEHLEGAGGNITKAAKALGVSRQLFSYRMMKFGLNHRDFKK
ncbi:sigma 54-interacting transcriptional regulator [Deltaproteobacteria bacterium OttesenSCG-928-M10]|nr:sigma 54-interacting transcriptional regulator [Deltaproteobacteria bacterium OttesenSCG-928-M10]